MATWRRNRHHRDPIFQLVVGDGFSDCRAGGQSGEQEGASVAVGDLEVGGIRLQRTEVYYGPTGAYHFAESFSRS